MVSVFFRNCNIFNSRIQVVHTGCTEECCHPQLNLKVKAMKYSLLILALLTPIVATAANEQQPLSAKAPLVYVNKNLGFNVKGYKYKQSEFPCDVDKVLVDNLVEQAHVNGIRMEPVGTADKILNGVIPVLAIDIEQLALGGEERQFGVKQGSKLPKVQVTAALIKGKDNMVTAKHTCAIMALNEFTPSSDVLDLGSNGVTVCAATRKCLKDLSKDVVQWIEPQIQ